MDQFRFIKKFTWDIVASSKRKHLNTPQTLSSKHEADILNKNDGNLPRHAQKSKEQFNSSLQNTSKRGVKGL